MHSMRLRYVRLFQRILALRLDLGGMQQRMPASCHPNQIYNWKKQLLDGPRTHWPARQYGQGSALANCLIFGVQLSDLLGARGGVTWSAWAGGGTVNATTSATRKSAADLLMLSPLTHSASQRAEPSKAQNFARPFVGWRQAKER